MTSTNRKNSCFQPFFIILSLFFVAAVVVVFVYLPEENQVADLQQPKMRKILWN